MFRSVRNRSADTGPDQSHVSTRSSDLNEARGGLRRRNFLAVCVPLNYTEPTFSPRVPRRGLSSRSSAPTSASWAFTACTRCTTSLSCNPASSLFFPTANQTSSKKTRKSPRSQSQRSVTTYDGVHVW